MPVQDAGDLEHRVKKTLENDLAASKDVQADWTWSKTKSRNVAACCCVEGFNCGQLDILDMGRNDVCD